MDLRSDLLSFLEGSDVVLPEPFNDDTPLLSSGTLDSLALFNLVLWVEEKTGHSVDPTQVDILAVWDTVRLILRYLDDENADPGADPFVPASQPNPGRGSSRIQVVPYDPSLKDAVARFQTGMWSPDEGENHRYLEWKHEENPYAVEPRMYLAMDRGELIGMRSFYPSRWQVGRPTREVDLLVADDLLVRSDHRDEGIVTAVMEAAFEDLHGQGIDHVVNLTGGPVTILGSLAMGWRSVGSLDIVGRCSRGQRLRRAVRGRVGSTRFLWRYAESPRLFAATELNAFTMFDRHLDAHRVGDLAVELADTPRVKEMADFIRGLGHDGRLGHVRDEAFLEWRFRHPFHRYRFAYAWDDSLAGFVVLRWRPTRRAPDPRVYLVDFEARDERTLTALLKTVLHKGRFPDVTTWRATLPRPFVRTLDTLGFEPTEPERTAHGWPTVLVRSVDEARLGEDWTLHGTRLLDPANWNMRMIHTMAG